MRYLGANHHEHMILAHFNVFHCHPVRGLASYTLWLDHLPIPERLVKWISSSIREWGISQTEVQTLRRFEEFQATGGAYSQLQTTRVHSDSPTTVSLLC